MQKLLQHNQQRQLRLAEILIRNENWQKVKDLAEELNCSERIIKYDLKSFKDTFIDFKIESSHEGVRLVFNSNKGFKNIYKNIFESSVAFRLLEVLFFNDHYSINELADKLYISSSTLYRVIQHTNEITKDYGFIIETNPCKISGKEDKIRYFYYQFFFEKYTILSWPYDEIHHELMDELLTLFINRTNFKADFAYHNIAKLLLFVNLTRYKMNYYINKNGFEPNLKEIISKLSIPSSEINHFKKKFRLEITPEFMIEIFSPVIQDDYSFNYEQLLTKTDRKTVTELNHLDELLNKLSTENDIPLNNKSHLVLKLYNSIYLENYDPRSGYILYDRNTLFKNELEKYFPSFYQSVSDGIIEYRKLIGLDQNERAINYMIYTLFVEWENLLAELRKSIYKVRVLILSNRTSSHSYLLKNFLDSEYNDYITSDIYDSSFISKEILENLDCDFIVANFPLPPLKTKEAFYIENFPTASDLKEIYKIINQIYSKVYSSS